MKFTDVKVVIPARYGSTRLPGKALLLLQGKPLFWHVAQRCYECGVEKQNVVIATDDQRIVNEAEALALTVVLTSKDHNSGTDRINEVAISLNWPADTIVVNVQGDEPLIPAELIKEAIEFKVNNSDYAIATAVTPINDYKEFVNPNVVKAILGAKSQALYFTRAPAPHGRDENQSLKLAYRHIGIYVYTVDSLKKFCSFEEAPLEGHEKLEQLRALYNGLTIGAFVFYQDIPPGVDTREDFENLRQLM